MWQIVLYSYFINNPSDYVPSGRYKCNNGLTFCFITRPQTSLMEQRFLWLASGKMTHPLREHLIWIMSILLISLTRLPQALRCRESHSATTFQLGLAAKCCQRALNRFIVKFTERLFASSAENTFTWKWHFLYLTSYYAINSTFIRLHIFLDSLHTHAVLIVTFTSLFDSESFHAAWICMKIHPFRFM